MRTLWTNSHTTRAYDEFKLVGHVEAGSLQNANGPLRQANERQHELVTRRIPNGKSSLNQIPMGMLVVEQV